MDAPITHTNGPDPELAFAAIYEIEKIDAELVAEKMAYMGRAAAIRKRRKATIDEYRDRGLSKRDIVDTLAIRALNAKLEDVRNERGKESKDEVKQLDMFLEAVERGSAGFKAAAE